MRHALMEMVNRNIRFLDEVDNRSDFEKLIVHSYHLQKIAMKHKLFDISRIILSSVALNNTRTTHLEITKLFKKYKDSK